MIVAGLLCFVAAAVLLHSFKGEFGQETAGDTSMPVMEDTIDVSVRAPGPGQSAALSSVPQSAGSARWVVYVTGAVKKPGVYEIPQGSRTYQALEAAGGFNADADREAVNLAAMLGDGLQIHFPAKGEKREEGNTSAVHSIAGQTQQQAAQGTLININSASQQELESLPGIGPKTAQAIIAYRESNGGFKRAEDLLLVKGIGPKKYDALKAAVTVGK